MNETKKFPSIVEFYFYSMEESYTIQVVVNSEEEYQKLLEDTRECLVKLIDAALLDKLEFLKEEDTFSFMSDEISVNRFAYDLDKCLSDKGWKGPEIYKTHDADLWGKIDIRTGKYHRFYEDEDEPKLNEFEQIIQDAAQEVIKRHKQEIDEALNNIMKGN